MQNGASNMGIFSKFSTLIAAPIVSLGLLVAAPAQDASAAAIDVMVVVDESGSMSGEHAWLPGMISSLDTALSSLGITGNYGLVGFGQGSGSGAPRVVNNFTTAAAFGTAASGLLTNGSFEDGYDGIDFGFSNLTFGTNGATATNVILVTDEDRDIRNGALTLASTLALLTNNNALLNAVVQNPYTSDNNTSGVLGVDSSGAAYVADGSGGFTTDTGGTVGNGAGNTETDYANLALTNGGATWNLDLLRVGGATADSFTAAFVAIKVQEIQEQIPVPAPGMLIIFGLGVAGLAMRRRVVA